MLFRIETDKNLVKHSLPSKSIPVSNFRFEISVIPPSLVVESSPVFSEREETSITPPLSLSPAPNLNGSLGKLKPELEQVSINS